MPQLIKTPEQWFRTKKADIYYFKPARTKYNGSSDDDVLDSFANFDMVALPNELLAWFKSHLPHRKLQQVAPSEHSRWLAGGPVNWAMELNADDLDAFMSDWEDSNGKSIDSRFQCFVCPYSRWLERVSRIRVFAGAPPSSEFAYRWVISKYGIFWIKGDFVFEESPSEHKVTYQSITLDDLWRVQQSFPSIKLGVDEVVLAGSVNVRDGRQSCAFDYFEFSVDDFANRLGIFDGAKELSVVNQIRNVLKLAQDAEVFESCP
jgi:hypothetical protein